MVYWKPMLRCEVIGASWCICALINWAIIHSDNGLSTVWHKVIAWSNTGSLKMQPLGTTHSKFNHKEQISVKYYNAKLFFQGNATKCAIYDMSTIMFISCEIALIWMSLDFTDDQSKLVQVMACCRQATSHYLSQCWPRSLLPYGITRPQWVN